jgi:hypothetical protein
MGMPMTTTQWFVLTCALLLGAILAFWLVPL